MSENHKPLSAAEIEELLRRLRFADVGKLATALSAAQGQRLTGDEFVRWCGNCACGKDEAACDSTATGHDDFDGVKCSGWSPRLTEEQVEAVKKYDALVVEMINDIGGCDHSVGICCCDIGRALEKNRAAFPCVFGKGV